MASMTCSGWIVFRPLSLQTWLDLLATWERKCMLSVMRKFLASLDIFSPSGSFSWIKALTVAGEKERNDKI